MTNATIEQALEDIYTSVNNDNEDIDQQIANLKLALGDEKTVTINPSRLKYSNREGRKMMQSYFKKRGVIVTFSE